MQIVRLAKHFSLFLLCTLTALLWFPDVTTARELLTLDPAFQEVVLEEDQARVQTVISYKNDSEVAQEIDLFAQDFTQNDLVGGVAFITDNETYPHTLASFLQLDKNRLILQPGETQQLLITVENRASLSPGGHYAAVIARAVADPSSELQQPVLPAVSSLILVRKVGGERFHLSLVSTDWQPSAVASGLPNQIELTIRNDGNVHDIPRGTLTAIGLGGRTLQQGTVNIESLYVLPGTHRKINANLNTTAVALPIDFVTLELQGAGQYSGITYTWEESVIVVAWYTPIIVAVFFGLVFVLKKSRKAHHA